MCIGSDLDQHNLRVTPRLTSSLDTVFTRVWRCAQEMVPDFQRSESPGNYIILMYMYAECEVIELEHAVKMMIELHVARAIFKVRSVLDFVHYFFACIRACTGHKTTLDDSRIASQT